MNKKTLTILVLAVLFISSEIAKAELKIDLQISKNQWLLGEEIGIWIIAENTGDEDITVLSRIICLELKIKGPIRKKCRIMPQGFVMHNSTTHNIIKAKLYDLSNRTFNELGVVDEGNFEIWYEAGYIENPTASRRKAVSNHIMIELVRPLGMDAEVFKMYKDKCNGMILAERRKGELLIKYPTSIYAGRQLYSISNNLLSDPWVKGESSQSCLMAVMDRNEEE